MSLVCATHFSEAAQRAATAAAELARRVGEPLFLVHVLAPESVRAFGRTLEETAEAALADEARRLAELGAEVGHQLLTGEPAEAVARFAQEREASLVVVAGPTHGSPFLGVGGTVDRLEHALPMPLLVVRDEAPFEAWAKGQRALKVMLGVDRSLPYEAARHWVKGLRRYGPVEVVAGHVFWPHEEYERLGLQSPLVFADVTPDLRQALRYEVEALVAPLEEAGHPVKVKLEQGVGRIADHLVELAAQEGVDLLVVGTHQRRALGKLWSVSHHAVRLAKMSVVSVPVAAVKGAEVSVPLLKTVLVATDFSEAGNRAVPYALALLPRGGTVHLVYVAEDRQGQARHQELEQQLRALLPSEAEAQGRKVEVAVLSSEEDTATQLVKAAERLCVDVICMGTHGRGGLARVVMGSVAKAVMAHTPRPVLVVRPPES